MIDEKDIIRQCIRKDRKAQKILFDTYAPVLLGICLRFTGNKHEAEDVLQEGFVKIFSNISEFEGRSSLIAWMKRIVINTAITFYHRNLKHHYHIDLEDARDILDEKNDFSGAEFTIDELLEVIATLPQGYRIIFNLYAIEGYKHREIAEQLKIDINTSKSQYSRAKKIIQMKLELLQKEATKIDEETI